MAYGRVMGNRYIKKAEFTKDFGSMILDMGSADS
jgi:hypothetical protein